jgi:hypothetical protein
MLPHQAPYERQAQNSLNQMILPVVWSCELSHPFALSGEMECLIQVKPVLYEVIQSQYKSMSYIELLS